MKKLNKHGSYKVADKRRKTLALLSATIIPILLFLLLIVLTDRPFWSGDISKGKNQRAAVAIRDNVTPFQKWGTRIFTWPYLTNSYGTTYYFTQTSWRDNRKEDFQNSLKVALENYEQVDIFILAHANVYHLWVAEIDEDLRTKIRLVYNTGCGDASQAERWLVLGADTYIGHPGASISPVFYFYFLRRWTQGYDVEEALEQSNRLTRNLLVRVAYFSIDQSEMEMIWKDSKAELSGRRDINLGGSSSRLPTQTIGYSGLIILIVTALSTLFRRPQSTEDFPWHIVFPVTTMLVQIGVFISLWSIYTLAYDGNMILSEIWIVPLTNVVLAIGGILGGFFAVVGVYLLIVRSTWWMSVNLITLCCLPSIACACVWSYAFLIFLYLV